MRMPQHSKEEGSIVMRVSCRAVMTGIAGAAILSLSFAGSPNGSAATADDPVLAVSGDIACAPGKTPSATRCQHAATGNLLGAMDPD
ncbi:MAG TPA: hypothetical protein VJ966_13225, partial [Actinomycetes bacterium]|nr:hypothetical protein [Actinomycetes bacterium]